MSLATRLKTGRVPLSETGLSGASGSTFTAGAVVAGRTAPGTLTAKAAVSILAGSTTASVKWQVSDDNSTYVDVKPANGAAIVGFTSSTSFWLQGPPALQANQYARLALTTSGSSNTTSANLLWAVSYNWEDPEDFYTADVRRGINETTYSSTGSAPGTTVAGPTLATNPVVAGALQGNVTLNVDTSSLTLNPKWQVSADASTWVDFKMTNLPANVVAATGTGTSASYSYAYEAPSSLCSHPYVRLAVVTGGASVTATDDWTISYNYAERALK